MRTDTLQGADNGSVTSDTQAASVSCFSSCYVGSYQMQISHNESGVAFACMSMKKIPWHQSYKYEIKSCDAAEISAEDVRCNLGKMLVSVSA